MRVPCSYRYVERINDRGYPVEGVEVTCGRCDHTEFSFGTSGRSLNRCLALLNDECPNDESNFYEVDS